jgi:formamidopyrimidine-DNA glycosylase
MWDFPELEIWSKNLTNYFKERKILDVFCSEKLSVNISSTDLKNKLYGRTIKSFNRYGNSIILSLSERKYLTIKLSKDSYFLITEKEFPSNTRLVFNFFNFSKLLLIDPSNTTIIEFSNISNQNNVIAKNIATDFSKFDEPKFLKLLNESKINIKDLLTSDMYIQGIGKLCADEILFNAGINPKLNVEDIPLKKQAELYESIFNVLNSSLYYAQKEIGNTLNNSSYNWVRVYGRKGKSCYVCGKSILIKKNKTHESYYCPRCQK